MLQLIFKESQRPGDLCSQRDSGGTMSRAWKFLGHDQPWAAMAKAASSCCQHCQMPASQDSSPRYCQARHAREQVGPQMACTRSHRSAFNRLCSAQGEDWTVPSTREKARENMRRKWQFIEQIYFQRMRDEIMSGFILF